ncbi:DUF6465 family protein [Butyrivibrio proteoclasticus]|uniref:DUF6465 family protein n=1 Tax=Butyrivibrio proteoclasticus TaxID=43305 RepID=UPI000ACBC31F|nr:DUF6465 family protein [Butyrivibrio proteoclasticus]
MAEIKKTEATVKPVATIKTGVVATEAKKEETKVVAAAKTEVKAEAKKAPAKKAPAKKAAAKKPAAKKAPAKKAEPKKTETKPAAKKPATKKATTAKKPAAKKAPAKKAAPAALKANIVLQYADKNVTYDTLVENAENVWQYDMGKKVSDIKKLNLYVKPEENTVYFVVNDKEHNQYGL